ncbi:MAG: hypothetical protein ACRDRK_24815 [Pseudonocardia sp.]
MTSNAPAATKPQGAVHPLMTANTVTATRPVRTTGTVTDSGTAFTVWAVAFAVAVLVFEWQAVVPVWSLHTLSGIAAVAVLLAPATVWRTALLCGVLGIEFISLLPNPYSAALLAHLTAAAVAVSWIVLRLRSPQAARDPGAVFERIAPFLRITFLLSWFLDAFAKLNTGFLFDLGTCAPDFIDEIPVLRVPEALYPAAAVAMLALEFGIPALLLFRRTRSVGIVVALGYYAILTAGGNPSQAVLACSALLVFLPVGMLSSAAATLRAWVPPDRRLSLRTALRSPWALVVLSGMWLLALEADELMAFEVAVRVSRWSAIAIGLVWLALGAWLLVRLRGQLVPDPIPPVGLRVRDGVLIGALAIFVLNAASPYIGLKTDYSFDQYSNLRTESGHWNHLVLPEAVRIFGSQDHLVRLIHAKGDRQLVNTVESKRDELLVLTDARRLVAKYPDGQVHYELDGEPRFAARLANDPVLGAPVSPITDLLGRWRRIPLDGGCRF